MKKIIIGVLVLAVGALGYWLLSPLWRTEVVNEALPEETVSPVASNKTATPQTSQGVSAETEVTTPAEPKEFYRGNFTGFDRLHQGSGTAKIVRVGDTTYLRFESDFTVSNGPDLFVGFGKDGQYSSGSEVGVLKGNVGSQNYELIGEFDASRYNEVYVWCRAFSVPFAKAPLVPVQ